LDFSSISIILIGSTSGLLLRIFIQNNFKKNISFYSQWLAHLSIGFFIIAAVYTEQFDYEENLLFEKESTNEIKLQNNKTAIIKNIKQNEELETLNNQILEDFINKKTKLYIDNRLY